MSEKKEIEKMAKTKIEGQEEAFKFLLEQINKTTEEYFESRKREINLMQKLFNAEKKVSALIHQISRGQNFEKKQED